MGTTKVTIRRTAKKKDGSSEGTVKNAKKTTVTKQKVTTSKSRTVSRKTGNVGYIKSS